MKDGKTPTEEDIKVAKELAKKAKHDAKKGKKQARIAKKDAKILAKQSKTYQWPGSPTKYSRVSRHLGSSRIHVPLAENMIQHYAPETDLLKEHQYVQINGHFFDKNDIDKFRSLGGSLDALPEGVGEVNGNYYFKMDIDQNQETSKVFNDARQ